jgi:hypothetical protein
MDSFEGREAASLLLPSPTILAIDLQKTDKYPLGSVADRLVSKKYREKI